MLYEDLIYTVLSKLPVKSLLRLRCVSKLWLNLIDNSSYFINMHLDHTKTNSSNAMFIQSDLSRQYQILPMYALDFDNPEDEVRKIEPPVPYKEVHVHTCNGLICLCSEDDNTIIIWNPATRKHRQVAAVKGCYPYCFGFGYDHKTDDYKVVMLEELIKEEEKYFIVHVYSLKTGLWRRTSSTTNAIVGPYLSVYASGAIHWMDYYPVTLEPREEMKHRLVAFDLTTEKWLPRTMPPQRQIMPHSSLQCWALSNHQESLCASFCANNHIKPTVVDLWVMKYQEGIKSNSWSKLVTVERNKGIPTTITPVWSLKKMSRQQVLLNNGDKLYLYDTEKGTREDFLHVVGVPVIYKCFICYQSLVPV